MTNEAVQKRREYQRAWRAANRDKVKANNARYWEKKAAEAAAVCQRTPVFVRRKQGF